jgi:large subunit ribosomal protein L9
MEIILNQDFKGLGYKNDVVTVKPGYARNYLIPKGIALVANTINVKIAKENAKQMAHKFAKRKEDATAIAIKLADVKLKIAAKAGEKGKIFGAITAQQLVDAIQAQIGYLADRKDISFDQPAKTVGLHKATLKLHKEVNASVQFEVISNTVS